MKRVWRCHNHTYADPLPLWVEVTGLTLITLGWMSLIFVITMTILAIGGSR